MSTSRVISVSSKPAALRAWRRPALQALAAGAIALSFLAGCSDSGSEPTPAPAAGLVLSPGTGFDGDTPTPGPVGAPETPGHDALSIARWDVVPDQTFAERFQIGVIAFHINEIERVDFSLEGGPWTPVAEMTSNPRTGIVEYWATLDAPSLDDGPVEVRAIAFPVSGIPRLLEPLTLFANAGGALTSETVSVGNASELEQALQTISSGGVITITAPGDYWWPRLSRDESVDRWVTIQPAEGLTRDDVVIHPATEDTVWPIGHSRFHNVSFDFATITQIYNMNSSIWFDQCRWFDSAPDGDQMSPVRYDGKAYSTGCLGEDLLYGFTGHALVRSSAANRIIGDVYQNSELVVDCTADHVDGAALEHHTDLFQTWGEDENIIIYGLTATRLLHTQAIFLQPTYRAAEGPREAMRNSAFVNIDLENDYPGGPGDAQNGGPPFSQLQSEFEHVLFRNVRWKGQRMMMRTDFGEYATFEATHLLFDQCGFHPATYEAYVDPGDDLPSGVEVRDGFPVEP